MWNRSSCSKRVHARENQTRKSSRARGTSSASTRRYVRHLKILEERPANALGNVAAAKALLRWSATEREAWLDAVINDPLLPGRLLPTDYLGQQAWRRRVEVLRAANRQLRTFKPE